jgi:hypothetical protein
MYVFSIEQFMTEMNINTKRTYVTVLLEGTNKKTATFSLCIYYACGIQDRIQTMENIT